MFKYDDMNASQQEQVKQVVLPLELFNEMVQEIAKYPYSQVSALLGKVQNTARLLEPEGAKEAPKPEKVVTKESEEG